MPPPFREVVGVGYPRALQMDAAGQICVGSLVGRSSRTDHQLGVSPEPPGDRSAWG